MPLPTIQWKAMGTVWTVDIFDDHGEHETLETNIRKIVADFEQHYSRFISTSLISKLNTDKVLHNAPDELLKIIQISQEIYNKTNGIFTICCGTYMDSIGYDPKYSFLSEANKTGLSTSFDTLTLKGTTIQLDGHAKIDLGGIGKGWVIDKVTTFLKNEGLKYFIVNGGGDIAFTSDHGNPLPFYLQHPHNKDTYIGKVLLKDCAIASSSKTLRTWTDQRTGDKKHHIFEKSSNCPLISVHTIASSAIAADTAGTTLLATPHNQVFASADILECEFLGITNDMGMVTSPNYPWEEV